MSLSIDAPAQGFQGLRLDLDDVLHSALGHSLPTDFDAHDGRGDAEQERVHGIFPEGLAQPRATVRH